MKKFIHDIELDTYRDYQIFLDIDGTITSDGCVKVMPEISKKIALLRQNNRVLLCSNKKLTDRDQTIANSLKIEYIYTVYRKPDKRVLSAIKTPKNAKKLVIGDKLLTDGLFAKAIKAQFLLVKRVKSKNDAIATKVIYFIDDIFSLFFSRFFL